MLKNNKTQSLPAHTLTHSLAHVLALTLMLALTHEHTLFSSRKHTHTHTYTPYAKPRRQLRCGSASNDPTDQQWRQRRRWRADGDDDRQLPQQQQTDSDGEQSTHGPHAATHAYTHTPAPKKTHALSHTLTDAHALDRRRRRLAWIVFSQRRAHTTHTNAHARRHKRTHAHAKSHTHTHSRSGGWEAENRGATNLRRWQQGILYRICIAQPTRGRARVPLFGWHELFGQTCVRVRSSHVCIAKLSCCQSIGNNNSGGGSNNNH